MDPHDRAERARAIEAELLRLRRRPATRRNMGNFLMALSLVVAVGSALDRLLVPQRPTPPPHSDSL